MAPPLLPNVGDVIDAKDRVGVWYEAKVVGKRRRDDKDELRIHFKGWRASTDEWISEPERLQQRGLAPVRASYDWGAVDGLVEEEEAWEVESILDQRSRDGHKEYLVRWVGWDKGLGEGWDDMWLRSKDIAAEIINEFKEQARAARPRAATPRRSRGGRS